ncbi:HAMP domain-containing sensor histidine kinase [Pseudomonas sp.]|uniref:sensor histidine kinase n=1 Tax=Pseudomonas sp. TaxID=306 RepID=UPI0027357FBE|nr:ATP-binding protein [Pseudomonas sp.]MDP3814994.1 ATP-binding protein [Pseudomonas sp.]
MSELEDDVRLRQLQRERNARKAAETLLESKSLELYLANQQLLQLNATLEQRVHERTQELVAARDQALEASRIKSQFIATVSHELRTPLHAVISYSEMLLEDLQGAGLAQQLQDQRKIHGAAQHLQILINELLDFTKLEAGKVDADPEAIDLDELVDNLLDTLSPLAEQNGNRLEVQLAGDAGELVSDRLKLNQCLYNLLSNACKFTERGLVRLEIRRERGTDQDWLCFAVSDNGIGMDEAQLSRLFQPFSQGDSSITRKYGGTGLGLAISRGLCELLGGTIDVSSTPGQGSCFRMRIPAVLPTHPPAPETAPLKEDHDASA